MNCSKCNAWVPDDSAFCPECGQKVEAPAPVEPSANVFCENCGAAMTAGDSFCENCGTKVEAPAEAAAPVAAAAAAAAAAVKNVTQKLNIPAKYLKLGLAAVALVLVVVIIASLFSGPKVNNYAIYIKDSELQYIEMPKAKDIVEVTSNLAEDVSDSDLAQSGSSLGSFIRMSEDGKKLFYPDKVDDGFTLYYRDITNTKKEPVKIDSDLTDYYYINAKGTLVTYVKEGKLYQHDLKEKTKIASDVVDFAVSEDGKTLLYLVREDDEEGYDLYLKKGNKDAEKLASEVTELVYADEDFKEVTYMKEDSLYIQNGTKDPEKVSSDVSYVLSVYEDGSFYYVKSEESELTYWDLIDDDYEDKDDYLYESYAEWMKEDTLSLGFYTLCYYNGKESTTICESMSDWTTYAYETPVLVYTALESAELPTWSLTEYINGEISLYDELEEHLAENSLYYIAAEESTAALELEDIRRVRISADGKTMYVGAEYDEEDYVMTLYQLSLNGSKVKKSEKLDEDVYAGSITLVDEDSVVYYKDVDDSEGELYMDGKKVDDDVYVGYMKYNTETEDLYYMVDWDSEDRLGSLKYWNGKKATAVKDDVYANYYFTPEGEVLFLYDYDDYKGELWIQDGKKIEKIDDDVSCIVPIY